MFENARTDSRVRRFFPPVRVVKTFGDVQGADEMLLETNEQIQFSPKHICTLTNREGEEKAGILLDFGIEFPGTVRLKLHLGEHENGQRIAKVRVSTGESAGEALAPIGHKNTTNDHAVRDRIANLDMMMAYETNESGQRFVYIELQEPVGMLALSGVLGVSFLQPLPYLGRFSCSDELLNRIWNTSAYTVHACMQEYLWDGIKRDRLVWIGDMSTEVKTVGTVFGDFTTVKKSLDLVREDTPVQQWMNGIPSYSLWWIVNQGEVFNRTGDKEYLGEQKEYLISLLTRLCQSVGEDGYEDLPGWQFLDWPNSENQPAAKEGVHALFVMALTEGERLMNVLGQTEVALLCAKALKTAKSVRPNPNGSKQAASILAITGLCNPKDADTNVIEPGGASGYSTFFGYYILKAKALAGNMKGALDAIRVYWGKMLSLGATTFWEDFNLDWTKDAYPITDPVPDGENDIHGDHGAYCYLGYRHSLCHGWSSGPCPFLSEYVLGIRCLGSDTYEVKPNLGDLSFAEGCVPTSKGILSVTVRKDDDGKTVLSYNAPEGLKVIV